MPPPSKEELSKGVVHHIRTFTSPEDDRIASASCDSAELQAIQAEIDAASTKVKRKVLEVRQSDSEFDDEEWIKRAERTLQLAEASRQAASKIIKSANLSDTIQTRVEDSSSKAKLLQQELGFSTTLIETTHRIKHIWEANATLKNALAGKDVTRMLERATKVPRTISDEESIQDLRIFELLQRQRHELLDEAVQKITDQLNDLITFRNEPVSVEVKSSDPALTSLVTSLEELGALEQYSHTLSRHLDERLIQPALQSSYPHRKKYMLEQHQSSLSLTGFNSHLPANQSIDDVQSVLNFLTAALPPQLRNQIVFDLVSKMSTRLKTMWLDPSIPSSIEQKDLEQFESILQKLQALVSSIDPIDSEGSTFLHEWLQRAPKGWLSRKREDSFQAIRRAMRSELHRRCQKERVETQMVNTKDASQEAGNAEWDNEWSEWKDEEEKPAEDAPEEFDAWGLDEDNNKPEDKVNTEQKPEHDEHQTGDDGEAWGWDDDAHGKSSPRKDMTKPKAQAGNGADPEDPKLREVTLREKYTVTGLPDSIIEQISHINDDITTLLSYGPQQFTISEAISGLNNVPTLILAIYRATASSCYGGIEAGNMLLYNDSDYLAAHLASHFTDSDAMKKFKLSNEIKIVSSFGKRAYAKEIESQRTILRDLLDGAQGFANSAEEPFKSQCEDAVASCVAHIRNLARLWDAILSESALRQALGSLVSTVSAKIIVEVQDLGSISDDESKHLRTFIDQITGLSDLFTQDNPKDGSEQDLTSFYVSNWFKLQYLAEILVSTLADIKYLWMEAELQLEFEAEEIVELIEALFTASDLRRKTIGQIRRQSIG